MSTCAIAARVDNAVLNDERVNETGSVGTSGCCPRDKSLTKLPRQHRISADITRRSQSCSSQKRTHTRLNVFILSRTGWSNYRFRQGLALCNAVVRGEPLN